MYEWSDTLKLGKGSAFVKRDLRALPLTDAEFEADFFLDRRFSTRRREQWCGMVIEREFAGLLALENVEWPPPTANDLATLLACGAVIPGVELEPSLNKDRIALVHVVSHEVGGL